MTSTASPPPERSVATLWSRNVHLLVLTMVLAVVAGLAAYVGLPRLEDPRIVHRNPLVITAVPGASAERVEALVTEPLEEELQQILQFVASGGKTLAKALAEEAAQRMRMSPYGGRHHGVNQMVYMRATRHFGWRFF